MSGYHRFEQKNDMFNRPYWDPEIKSMKVFYEGFRMDKANIKGTNERITQPGHIAIIYSQEQDAIDYTKYLDFLASKKFVQPDYQDFELEDLQGITGLKALRAKVNYSVSAKSTEGYTVDELMETIKIN